MKRRSPKKLLAALSPVIAALVAAAQTAETPLQSKVLSSPPVPPALPSFPVTRSGVDFFRELLAATPAERQRLLADKTPEHRQVLLNSLREYQTLPPHEREARLRKLELRLHLGALMRLPPSNRVERLRWVPASLIQLVNERLEHWDQLNRTEQAEFWKNERAMRLFVPIEHGKPANEIRLTSYSAQQLSQIEKDIAHWKELPIEQQQRIYGHFQKMFELPDPKEDAAFNKFNDAEKQQMEKTLADLKQMPRMQRQMCINNFSKFAEMSAQQRREFLGNAEVWSQMKPEDRQLWRDLVRKVPPLPPSPPGFDAPILPPTPPTVLPKTSLLATNQ